MARRPAPKKLARKLAQIRMDLGLSQAEMVRELNYKASPLYPSQISNFEQAKTRTAADDTFGLRPAG
jgi:transcriptional regulator with XRE-family HTH domain